MEGVKASVASGSRFFSLSLADNESREKIKMEVYQLVNQKYPEGKVLIESSALIISGEK
jgi:hypothetical protein